MDVLVAGAVGLSVLFLFSLLGYLWLTPARSKASPPPPARSQEQSGPSTPTTMWTLEILDRSGAPVGDRRIGWVDEVLDHVVEADGSQYLEFVNEDVLAENHAELRGLKGKTVEIELSLGEETTCRLVGRVVDVDRETGAIEIMSEGSDG